jgi:hypothetical protein
MMRSGVADGDALLACQYCAPSYRKADMAADNSLIFPDGRENRPSRGAGKAEPVVSITIQPNSLECRQGMRRPRTAIGFWRTGSSDRDMTE